MAKGSSYWNTGTGTDDFGFSLLGAGNRADDGSFSTFPTKAYGSLHTATRSGTSQNIVLSITDNGSNLVVLETTNMTRGRSIRLIKR
jgi:uncharacterized protein (TIGR02145 family)